MHRVYVDGREFKFEQAAADAMETSPSNVDNLERAVRKKIRHASSLMALLADAGYEGNTVAFIESN